MLYYAAQGKCMSGPFDSMLVTKGKELLPKWKVMLTRSTKEHAGQPDKNGQRGVFSTIKCIEPNSVCTNTYLIVDSFETQGEAEALVKYLKTRFVRFLFILLAQTQNITKDKFALIPVQDFTSHSDIDWAQDIESIDAQLNRKYQLTSAEAAYIRKLIKPC